MQSVDYRSAMLPQTDTELTRAHTLTKHASRWNSMITRELRRFARYLWPDVRLLGLVPIQSFRLRKRLESGKVVWWVEHDIPPFDRYRCEAYRVELSLAGPDQPQLVVRSGTCVYPVTPSGMESLKSVLVQVAADTPLVIPRQFGSALD